MKRIKSFFVSLLIVTTIGGAFTLFSSEQVGACGSYTGCADYWLYYDCCVLGINGPCFGSANYYALKNGCGGCVAVCESY